MAAQGHTDTINCPKCFTVVKRGSEFCPECGATLGSGEGSDTEVYNDLAKANLLRNRHSMQEAIDVALGILRKYPNNATAHTLLGDIYAELDDLKQSAEWYEMALDLNPDSASDRLKLEKVRDRMAQQQAASTARSLGIPQSRNQVYTYVAAIVGIVLIVAMAGFVLGKKSEVAAKKTGVSSPFVVPGETSAARPDPGQTTDPSSGPLRISDVLDDANAMTILQANTKLKDAFLSAVVDPRSQVLMISVRADADQLPEVTAYEAAIETLAQLPNYKKLTVRVVRARKIEFMGDTSTERITDTEHRGSATTSQGDLAKNAFENTYFAATSGAAANPVPATDAAPATGDSTPPTAAPAAQGTPPPTFPANGNGNSATPTTTGGSGASTTGTGSGSGSSGN